MTLLIDWHAHHSAPEIADQNCSVFERQLLSEV